MQENCYDATECPIDYKIATSSEYKGQKILMVLILWILLLFEIFY